MELASQSAGIINDTFDEIRAKLETLATRKFEDTRTVESVLEKLFPPSPLESQQNRVNNRRQEAKLSVSQLFVDNDADTFPDQSRTAYALFNAVTNHVDHEKEMVATRSRRSNSTDDLRATNSLFGTGSDFKSNALDLILRETERLPSFSRSYSIGGAEVLEAEYLETKSDDVDPKSLLDSILDQAAG